MNTFNSELLAFLPPATALPNGQFIHRNKIADHSNALCPIVKTFIPCPGGNGVNPGMIKMSDNSSNQTNPGSALL